jgi:hypothetical protein
VREVRTTADEADPQRRDGFDRGAIGLHPASLGGDAQAT